MKIGIKLYKILKWLTKMFVKLYKIANIFLFLTMLVACMNEDWDQIIQDPNVVTTKDWLTLYKIVNIFSFFLMATAEFLTYEETVPLLRKQCVFKDYTFFKRDVLVRAVECLPDDPYNDSSFLPAEPPPPK